MRGTDRGRCRSFDQEVSRAYAKRQAIADGEHVAQMTKLFDLSTAIDQGRSGKCACSARMCISRFGPDRTPPARPGSAWTFRMTRAGIYGDMPRKNPAGYFNIIPTPRKRKSGFSSEHRVGGTTTTVSRKSSSRNNTRRRISVPVHLQRYM